MRLKRAASLVTTAPDRGELPYVALEHVGSGTGKLVADLPLPGARPASGVATCQPGDVLVGKLRPYLNKTFRVQEEIYASTELMCLRPGPHTDTRWLSYLVSSAPIVEWAVATSDGSKMPRTSWEKLGNVQVSQPHLAQQQTIADYLDTTTARIDAVIVRKESLIIALSDRLRVMARAITTDSVRTAPVRRAVKLVKTGTTPPASEFDALQGEDVGWYSPSDVGEWLAMREPSRRLSGRSVSEGWVPTFPADSTLIIGIGATAGRVGHLETVGSGNQQMTCLVADREALPRFLSWQLFARSDEIRETAPYTTLPIINNDFLRSLMVHLPDLEQQAQVVLELDELARRTQSAITAIGKQLERLTEHRQALITAAVTGALAIPTEAAA